MNRLFLLLFLAVSCVPEIESVEQSIQYQLDSLLSAEHEINHFNGAVAAGTYDTLFYIHAVGKADRVWDISLQPDHRFDICSLNKSFIAAMVLQAAEEGRLNLTDRLSDVMQNYTYEGRFDPKITIHQMLTHTSGLPDYDAVAPEYSADSFRKFKSMHVSNEEYVNLISRLPAVGKPGQQFYYSNFAYHLLAVLLEDIYGKSFADILEERICGPLEMNQTFNTTSDTEVYPKTAEGYNLDQKTNTWKRNSFIDLTLGRRIFSSVGDLYKWGKAVSDTTVLGEESLRLMQTNHLSELSDELSYGYGWVVFDGKGKYSMGDLGIEEKYIIHGGNTEGYKSMLVNIEDGEFIIAMLSNSGDQTKEIEITKKIVHILINSKNEN